MTTIPFPLAIDRSLYENDTPTTEPFYGLPREVKYCSRCTYSNQKPNSEQEFKHALTTRKPTLRFDAERVCLACRVAEEKETTDWEQRRRALEQLCDEYRRSDGGYDVLVPGSGGKDSFYASWVLKHEFGMNPLTVTWAPHMYTDWGQKNHRAWVDCGFDNILFSPNGLVQRLLTRLALERIFHPFQPFMMGQMYYPPKLAAKFGIELVFYGENPTEYGNVGANNKATKDLAYITTRPGQQLFISGTAKEELKDDFKLSEVDLQPYMPPTLEDMQNKNINIQYLGYYLKWHPQNCYYYATEHGKFRASSERSTGTYSKYSSIDDKMDDFHYYTTFIKFGIGRATYDTAQEIRNNDITREEGVSLVKRFDGEYPARFEKEIYEYLSVDPSEMPEAAANFDKPAMDADYFHALIDRFRSPHLWKYSSGSWHLRKSVE
jgi:N-acetyl sugar amidotransferase